ncbi:MAG: hypothetical protein Q4G71_02600 [Pseudomonadota bacterium]|nr:hypothetical protein [Pseudomonadota bacterium]
MPKPARTLTCAECGQTVPLLQPDAALLARLVDECLWQPDPAPHIAAEVRRTLVSCHASNVGVRTALAARGGVAALANTDSIGGDQRLATNADDGTAIRHLKRDTTPACTRDDALGWADHLLSCCRSWPLFSAEDQAVLAQIDQAFGPVPCPAHFTDDYLDGCDSQDHDEVLSARPRERLRRGDLGQSGWNPLCFTHAAATAYLFPTLARYALMPRISGREAYADLLLWNLENEGERNRFFSAFTPAQRAAVARFLRHLKATRLEPDLHFSLPELNRAIATWGGHAAGAGSAP